MNGANQQRNSSKESFFVRNEKIGFFLSLLLLTELNKWKELVANCDQMLETMKYSYIPPFAFTEHEVTMLSSVLRSDVAIDASILVVRAFVFLGIAYFFK